MLEIYKNNNAINAFPAPAFGGDKIISELLREAIENELTEKQRDTLRAVWYGGEKVSALSRLEQVSEQSIRRRLKQCYTKLNTALRYAVRYSQLKGFYEDDV